jgi:ketosteroid isomerase-like protein
MLVAESSADVKAEEAAIRALIASDARLSHTEDEVFWSGAYKRPVVGSEKPEPYPESAAGKRRNQKNTVTTIDRLEVAASGDMAWEFSHSTLEWDQEGDPSGHVSVAAAELRVWKKVGGEWKVAAFFARPLDRPFAPR